MKKKRILVIVESPNKRSTISEILKEDDSATYVVMASVGHIEYLRDSGKYNLGIDVDNHFKLDYQIIPDKKKVVSELKTQVDAADEVYLASDPDREGERIAASLKKFLKIPEDKYKRIVFHEITKSAIFKAIKEARKIDKPLVKASETRDALDKIVGFRLTRPARDKVGYGCTVGRCQSAGLKLIVQREEEIQNFVPEKYFDLFLYFFKNAKEFKAKYCDEKGESKTLSNKEECDKVISTCTKDYIVEKVERKQQLENPQLPFTTSTFQREVIKKLGFTTDEAMNCAQKLFEGISINGKHVALTTYLRTDDANMSPDFLPVLEEYVKKHYGDKYYAPVRKAKKAENAQEGHECFRVIDLEMTPEKLSQYINDDTLLKVYSIIYNRTLASSMKPAIYSTTKYLINNNGNKFVMNSKELFFDGYKKVYAYKEDEDKEEVVKETFSENEVLKDTSLEELEKETKPKPRFTEDTFQNELDKRGIGRPSTFQTIIKIIKDKNRGYIDIVKKEFVPTDKGIRLSHFLDEHFGDVINLNYTAELEKDLDLIARDKMDEEEFLSVFYNKLEASIAKANEVKEVCPICGSPMVLRKGKFGSFLGCSSWPKCNGIRKLGKN